jgi:alpha-D-ribose 1-methylphosphonate 5-triphosphate synthase subunit PhnH
MPMQSAIDGAFRNPVFDAQATFRSVMDAMAQPGTLQPLKALPAPPSPLTPAGAAIALTLCDADTPLWIDPPLAASASARAWLAFHTGAPLTANAAEAHFALVSTPAELIALENFAQGSQDYPDRSTTLVLQVATIGSACAFTLEGPGIETVREMAVMPLPRHFTEQWKQNGGRFPRGLDLILAAPEGVSCLPRTTKIRAAET